jgi:radical SAM protein with 4Fe4S-binding SPASM domain
LRKDCFSCSKRDDCGGGCRVLHAIRAIKSAK